MTTLLQKIITTKPIIYSITNFVTANDCANAILALGGSPIMSEEFSEVEELVKMSNAIYINIGTTTKRVQRTIFKCIKCAKKYNKPIVFDPVGSGASEYRTNLSKKIIKKLSSLSGVVKGNVSELKSLFSNSKTLGVDSNENDNISSNEIRLFSMSVQKTVVATGKIDVISDGNRMITISNGSEKLKQMTGSGCMLGAIIATFCSATPDLVEASKLGTLVLNISSEKINNSVSTSSFRTQLIDNLSLISPDEIDILQKVNEN